MPSTSETHRTPSRVPTSTSQEPEKKRREKGAKEYWKDNGIGKLHKSDQKKQHTDLGDSTNSTCLTQRESQETRHSQAAGRQRKQRILRETDAAVS